MEKEKMHVNSNFFPTVFSKCVLLKVIKKPYCMVEMCIDLSKFKAFCYNNLNVA